MSFQHNHPIGRKPETSNSENLSVNPSIFQPSHQQMRNDYMPPPNFNEFGTQRRQAHMNQKDEMTPYQGKTIITEQNKYSNLNQYYRQGEPHYTPPHGQHQVAERRTDAHLAEDTRNASENVQYSFPSRDGPSPGRNYHYGIPQEDMQHREQPNQEIMKVNNLFRSSAVPTGSRNKRKSLSGDPTTPDGPRLISNQSSDDSINALLPSNSKRARMGSLFPTESASLFKSFTLSPLNSRTFSRDEQFDMSRFASTRGSAENNRIFQSWSSGNSRTENHSPSDVRICYDDWHSTPMGGRRGSATNGHNRPIENKGKVHEHLSQNQRDYDQRGQGPPTQNWTTYGREQTQALAQSNIPFDATKFDSRAYQSDPRQLQPLHPEDRYNEQLFSQGMDMNRGTYWDNSSVHPLYPSQRRDDIEDKSNNHMARGNPPHLRNTPRLPVPNSTVSNSWNRHGGDYHNDMYDSHGSRRNAHHTYDSWGQPSARGGHYDAPFNQNISMKDNGAPLYSDGLTHLKSVTIESGPNGVTGIRTADGILLLSLPEDKISLSETLCIVRENVEVFIATEADVKAPAPGRKRPVVEGQVGLRCIHCRAAVHQSEKVKRAVCFPSSIKRIYRTVIDMKLDHFKACRFVPIELKLKLEELRATNARSTGTTMQYFVQAATRMGMIDGGHGIRFEKPKNAESQEKTLSSPSASVSSHNKMTPQQLPNASSIMRRNSYKSSSQQQGVKSGISFSLSLDLSMSSESHGDSSKIKDAQGDTTKKKKESKFYPGKVVLALPEDKSALSPLRCFLRNNVCAFSATAEDIAVRTPTTFSVVLGQVGIGCIHCLSLPARERSNRAVCFPFSIGRMYQSVADIQRFHLSDCKMVPPSIRAQFIELQSASSKGSKGLATRQYWVSSALKLGLVDSDCGIRFARDPSIPLEKAKSLDILAQVASDVTTAAQPLVLSEDKPLIAEFLYVVMKQLQPCRFTEADRNKRRLKDVGCIGVECKHCAGQVDGRKFFWSSVNAVESNFVSVHTHMMECKMIDQSFKDNLANLKTLRKEQTARLKSGSQKAFFSRVWQRLHSKGTKIPTGNVLNQQKRPYTKPPSIENSSKQGEVQRNMLSPNPVGHLMQSPFTPPMSEFKLSASPSSISSLPPSKDDLAPSPSIYSMGVFNVKLESPTTPAFPSTAFTSEPEKIIKGGEMTTNNSSLVALPTTQHDSIKNATLINDEANVKKEVYDNYNVSVVEEI